MDITRTSPVGIDTAVISESTLICELKTKGTKKPIKVNIDTHVYYRHPVHRHMTNVTTSGIQSIYTSTTDSIHTIKMKIPEFRDYIRSQVYISVDSQEDLYIKVQILSIIIEEESKYEARKKEELRLKLDKLTKLKHIQDKFDIVCEGLMLGHSGLAKAMRNISLGLDKLGCNVKAISLDPDNIGFLNTGKGKRMLKLINNNNNEEHFWITMNNALAIAQHEYCYSIGYVMFETEIFPSIYSQHLTKQNEIWTPSTFCKDSITKTGLKNVFVMPLGVDTEQFNPEKVKEMECPKDLEKKYKFLSVMGYSERKGISILVRSFAEEFVGNKNVVLYIKGGWYNLDKAKIEISDMTKDIKDPPLIYLDFNTYSDSDMARLYKMCNCFVLPTRGEGFGLPIAEAMSMAMPTIATRWSGNLEFMNDDNSYLIKIDGVGLEPKCNWICTEYIGGKFARPNKDHLKQLMRYVYEHKEEAKQKGIFARKYILERYTWEKSCEKMYKRLKEIVQEF